MAVPALVTLATDPACFGDTYGAASWRPWHAALAVLDGRPDLLSSDDAAFARERLGLAAGAPLPREPAREAWLVCGRRAGKSHIAAMVAVAYATRPYPQLAAGEPPTVALLARDLRQAKVLRSYVEALCHGPSLSSLVVSINASTVQLATGARVEVLPAIGATVRGRTLAAAVCDEIAFWATDEDSAYRDTDVLEALRPALATTGGPLICLSSPWRREGALWEAYNRYHGAPADDVVVWHASTVLMNQSRELATYIERAERLDPVSAASEYGAEFRDDVGGYLSHDVIRGAVAVGVHQRTPPGPISHEAAQ